MPQPQAFSPPPAPNLQVQTYQYRCSKCGYEFSSDNPNLNGTACTKCNTFSLGGYRTGRAVGYLFGKITLVIIGLCGGAYAAAKKYS
jgi:hypothetical protein